MARPKPKPKPAPEPKPPAATRDDLLAFCRGAAADAVAYRPNSYEARRGAELLGTIVAWEGHPPAELTPAAELGQLVLAGLAAVLAARARAAGP